MASTGGSRENFRQRIKKAFIRGEETRPREKESGRLELGISVRAGLFSSEPLEAPPPLV